MITLNTVPKIIAFVAMQTVADVRIEADPVKVFKKAVRYDFNRLEDMSLHQAVFTERQDNDSNQLAKHLGLFLTFKPQVLFLAYAMTFVWRPVARAVVSVPWEREPVSFAESAFWRDYLDRCLTIEESDARILQAWLTDLDEGVWSA